MRRWYTPIIIITTILLVAMTLIFATPGDKSPNPLVTEPSALSLEIQILPALQLILEVQPSLLEAKPGDLVGVAIFARNAQDLAGIQVQLVFPNLVLEASEISGGDFSIFESMVENGSIRMVMVTIPNDHQDILLVATITFRVIGGQPGETSEIRLERLKGQLAFNEQGEAIEQPPPILQNGTLRIVP